MKPNLKLCVAVMICCAGLSAVGRDRIPTQPVLPSTPVFPEQPLNDTFANRAVITSLFPGPPNLVSSYLISGSLSNATSEEGEPFIDGVSSGQTVWGTWTAPSDGIVTLSVNAGTFSPLLTVYAGSAPISSPIPGTFPGSSIIASVPSIFTNLSLVASNIYLATYEHAECGSHWRERNQITFHVADGQACQICVDSAIIMDATWVQQPQTAGPYDYYSWTVMQITNVIAGGTVQLGLQFTPAPTNDDFERRVTLKGSRLNFTASNAGATKQSGEPDHLGNPGGSSVWYSWTAPASGRVTLSTNEVPPYSPPDSSGGGVITILPGPILPYQPTCGKEIDQNPPPVFYPVFAAYTGTAVDSLATANCLPAGLSAFPYMVEFDVVKGQTYQIAFDGNMGTTGEIPFYLALTKPASNDNFAHRVRLHGKHPVATSYNAGATHQAGEPVFGNSTGKMVWWSWAAPASGTVSVDLSGSDYSFPVAIFTGTTPGTLQMVAENSGGVSFQAVKGQIYQIAVSDSGGLTGAIDLKLQLLP
jgi:hypothetical protein